MYQTIDVEVSDGVGTLYLNRPEKKNAYLPQMGEDIVAALNAMMHDDAVRVVILTGRGDAFCAGVDLEFLKAHMAGEVSSEGPQLGEEHFVNGWALDLADYAKPVIAAINGAAYGVGVTMTLGCDVRYASSNAKLGLNFTRLGILPGLGSTHHLPQLVGMGKAMELILAGATLSAAEAYEAGLVQRLCEPGEVYAKARELALAMAQVQPQVLTAARHIVRAGANVDLAQAIANEKSASAALNAQRRAKD